MRQVRQLKNSVDSMAAAALVALILISAYSCAGDRKTAHVAVEAVQEEAPFHADNDIAMTVRSLVDAIRVGEVLDSAFYNFSGILTDGQGTPLYTDDEGGPGEWSVRVTDDKEALIRNLKVGDLMAADLRNYIVGALNLNGADLVTSYDNPDVEGEVVYVFDAGGVDVTFTCSPAVSDTGAEGWYMLIKVGDRSV